MRVKGRLHATTMVDLQQIREGQQMNEKRNLLASLNLLEMNPCLTKPDRVGAIMPRFAPVPTLHDSTALHSNRFVQKSVAGCIGLYAGVYKSFIDRSCPGGKIIHHCKGA